VQRPFSTAFFITECDPIHNPELLSKAVRGRKPDHLIVLECFVCGDERCRWDVVCPQNEFRENQISDQATALKQVSRGPSMKGKRVQFDEATWNALDLLSRDSMKDFQELADEAFADLLKKHRRPVTLKEALRESVRGIPANDPEPQRATKKRIR
jgi:hypothetical protein